MENFITLVVVIILINVVNTVVKALRGSQQASQRAQRARAFPSQGQETRPGNGAGTTVDIQLDQFDLEREVETVSTRINPWDFDQADQAVPPALPETRLYGRGREDHLYADSPLPRDWEKAIEEKRDADRDRKDSSIPGREKGSPVREARKPAKTGAYSKKVHARASSAGSALRGILTNPENLAGAIVFKEIFGPPVARRRKGGA